ncbi:MAG: hypothetical protein OEV78_09590 [Spirochaetia bacterium]|nr:hypothetical protein [Spirochaetia bacterium]
MKRWFLLFYIITNTGNLFSEEIGNGFLALNISGNWQRYDLNGKKHDFFKVPISFSAASSNYDIVTNLSIFPEILHLDQYYTGISRLENGALQPFSFGNFEIEYMLAQWKIFHINGGFKIGHYGYLTSDWILPSYTLFIGFKGSLYTFLGKHFMVKIPFEIPIGIYNHNISKYFTLFTGMEISFDPIGPIINPVSTSVFYSIGFEYNYLNLQTQNKILRTVNYYNTYFKFSLLY